MGQFPPIFGRGALIHRSTRGLSITVLAILLLANLVDLTAIASLGSVVALTLFLVLAVVGLRLRTETKVQSLGDYPCDRFDCERARSLRDRDDSDRTRDLAPR